jgi:ADP-glucose pyrophosphorylase
MDRYAELPFSYPSNYIESNGVLQALDARVQGNVNHSVLGCGCSVEDEAEVSHSLLMDACTVESGASVQDSVIGVGVVVPSGTVLKHCVVGDGAVLKLGETYLDKKIPKEP